MCTGSRIKCSIPEGRRGLTNYSAFPVAGADREFLPLSDMLGEGLLQDLFWRTSFDEELL